MGWWTGNGSAKGRALRKRGMHAPWRQCSRCGCKETRRSGRRHQWEWLLRAVRLYPFRCKSCKHRFLRFSLYER
jgi:hypothetical protein